MKKEQNKIFLYNTLTKKEETFKPIKSNEVGIYSCGPTVYWYQHIGNLRTYIFSDILKRTLMHAGYKIKQIINITDVGHLTSDADEGEDKMEKAAKKEHKSAQEIANHYFSVFHGDMKKLNILEPSKWTKATEHIKEQIELIKKLEKKGYTYKTSDGIYFNTKKFKSYGKLANLNINELKAGKRIDMGDKKNKTDFALWKFSNESDKRQQEWASPWGVGFPGWHIECSAMSMKYLGNHFDIHTGGQDHIPIHHTNEIAQSEAVTNKKFVNYWLHGAFLLFNGEKVSKSTGGLYTIDELEKLGYKPMHYRYLCLQTHYRKPLNFSLEALDASKNAYENLKRKIVELRKNHFPGDNSKEKYESEFHKAVYNDLSIPTALQVFHNALDDKDFDSKIKLKLLEHFDSILGLGIKEMKEEKVKIPKSVLDLAKEREKLRKDKMWVEADIIRSRIQELGFLVQDTLSGSKLEKN
ncbi:MAG: cysteine--tRNA ligase [Nanoarchaeota archaeon]